LKYTYYTGYTLVEGLKIIWLLLHRKQGGRVTQNIAAGGKYYTRCKRGMVN